MSIEKYRKAAPRIKSNMMFLVKGPNANCFSFRVVPIFSPVCSSFCRMSAPNLNPAAFSSVIATPTCARPRRCFRFLRFRLNMAYDDIFSSLALLDCVILKFRMRKPLGLASLLLTSTRSHSDIKSLVERLVARSWITLKVVTA